MKMILVWLMIIVPLGWGVTQSLKKSLPLFTGEKKQTTAPATPSAK